MVTLSCGLAIAQRITTFEARGAGTGAGQGTLAEGISPAGKTFGYYVDASVVAHGFIRSARGNFTTFDVPGAGTAAGQGTFPLTDNPSGTIAGFLVDGSGVAHGFVRSDRER